MMSTEKQILNVIEEKEFRQKVRENIRSVAHKLQKRIEN